MTENTIEIKNLNKFYGKKHALKNINLTIEKGMFGLLGRNGAGKTTLMRILATTLQKSDGEVKILGTDLKNTRNIRKITGYLPQEFSMYPSMSVYDALEYLGILSGMSGKNFRENIDKLLSTVNLQEKRNVKIRSLSGGMKRRLGIAQALLHNPKILIVDEPTAGLDPEERIRFRNLLSEVASERIVILSTHIVGDIEATCEKTAILNAGELIYNGTVENLIKNAEGNVYTLEADRSEIIVLKKKYNITGIQTSGNKAFIRFISDTEVKNAKLCTPNIEDAYMFYLFEKGSFVNISGGEI
ncbi:MAG TPA: ABC transporter ATP-binding protein [Tepiditoga sp.]|nr:ABC transporter ATP-binding protein [Thermotogota bacterium]HOO73792.1 ABC transporter ATP-binding protein [Tepiditoga sp.]